MKIYLQQDLRLENNAKLYYQVIGHTFKKLNVGDIIYKNVKFLYKNVKGNFKHYFIKLKMEVKQIKNKVYYVDIVR